MSRDFTIIDAPQRSDEWKAARLGRVTGSRAADVLATIKSGEAAARRDYRTQLVCERLTNTLQEDAFISPAMQWGIDNEPAAFSAYEALTGQMAQRTGFLAHTELPIGCSLDAHVGDFDGICEFKCPKSATHLRYLKAGSVPSDYLPQIRHNLFVTQSAWCDFMSFDPRMPAHLQTFLVRVSAADVDLPGYERAMRAFLDEIDREIEALQTITNLSSVMKAVTA